MVYYLLFFFVNLEKVHRFISVVMNHDVGSYDVIIVMNNFYILKLSLDSNEVCNSLDQATTEFQKYRFDVIQNVLFR